MSQDVTFPLLRELLREPRQRLYPLYALFRGRLTSRPSRPRPFFLSHMVTNRCNCDCPYCYWKYPRGEELRLEEILALYRQARRSGFAHVSIWGGEPLLRPDIGEIVRAAKENLLLTTVVTNGFNLERNHAFAQWSDTVVVSVDHPDPQHDALRGFPGLFERARAGLIRLRRDHPRVHRRICCVISRSNAHRLEEMCRFAREMGSVVYFCPIGRIESIRGWAGEETVRRVSRSPEEVAEDFKEVGRLKRAGYPVGNSDPMVHYLSRGGGPYPCFLPRTYLYVYGNGDVESCFSGVFANVRNRTLEEILDSEELREIALRSRSCQLSCRCSESIESSGLWQWRWASLRTWAAS
jgi:MoaA/NifB/PqqE/SkfB family radical SAM enzyme